MNLSLSNFKSKTLHTMRYCPRMRIICYLSSVKYFLMTYQSSGVQMMLSYPVNRRGTSGWVRITEWLRLGGPLEVSLRQGYLEPVAQDYIQMASECLQRWRVRNLPGKSVPVLAHHHSKSFLMFRGKLLCFRLCTLPMVLLLGTTEKVLVTSSSHHPFGHL